MNHAIAQDEFARAKMKTRRLIEMSSSTFVLDSEILQLLETMLESKRWSLDFFCKLYCIPRSSLEKAVAEREFDFHSPMLRRFIWMIVMFERWPEALMDCYSVATWGRNFIGPMVKPVRKYARLSNEEPEMIAIIKKMEPGKLAAEVSSLFSIPVHRARKLMRAAGYVSAPERSMTGVELFMLRGQVSKIDWRMSSTRIAKTLRTTTKTICGWRRKIDAMSLQELEYVIGKLDVNRSFLEPFIVSKKKQKSLLTNHNPCANLSSIYEIENETKLREGGVGCPSGKHLQPIGSGKKAHRSNLPASDFNADPAGAWCSSSTNGKGATKNQGLANEEVAQAAGDFRETGSRQANDLQVRSQAAVETWDRGSTTNPEETRQ